MNESFPMCFQLESPISIDGMTFIYGLVDPITLEVRYVGKSGAPKLRYLSHLAPSSLNSKTHKSRWIAKLIAQGFRPTLVILEQVLESEWEKAEIKWIARFNKSGAVLTNSTTGGEGLGRGFKMPRESVERGAIKRTGRKRPEVGKKLSAIFKGKPLKESTKKKLSLSHKRHWNSLTDEQRGEFTKNLKREWTPEESKKRAEKLRFKKPNRPCSSPQVGVAWFKRDSKWRAYHCHNGKQKHFGYFEAFEDAVDAYNAGMEKLFPMCAMLPT